MKPQNVKQSLLQNKSTFVSLLMLVCALVSCSGGMEKEAENAALKELGKCVVKCGDAFFIKSVSRISGGWSQYTKFYYKVEGSTSEVDRLNGLDWSGKVTFVLGGFGRSFPIDRSNQGWSDWSESAGLGLDVKVWKTKDGQWRTQKGAWYEWFELTDNVSCSDIPPDKHISTPEQEEAQRRYDQKRLEDLTKASRDIIRKNQEERATQGKP